MMITKEQKKIQKYYKAGLSEARNSKTYEQSEKSQHHAQRVCWNTDFDWSNEITLSSNRWPFHSFHTIHIKQPSTTFHFTEPCFPNQFLQQNNKAATVPNITQLIPNIKNTSPTEYGQHHNAVKDDPLTPHYFDTNNTSSPKATPFS